jgi:hypothetical protein
LAAAIPFAGCALVVGIRDTTDEAAEAGSGIDAARDAGANPDAIADAPFDGDSASSQSFCQSSTHTFCDDFDEQPLGAIWGNTSPEYPGALFLDDAAAFSAPRSLSVTSVPDAGDPPESVITKKLPGTWKAAFLDLDVRVDQLPSSTGITTAFTEICFPVPGGPNWHLQIHQYKDQTELEELHYGYPDGGYAYRYLPLANAFTPGKWSHVHLEVTAVTGTKPPHARFVVDGATLYDKDLVEIWQPTGLEVNLGSYGQWFGVEPWHMHYDNVTIDVTP